MVHPHDEGIIFWFLVLRFHAAPLSLLFSTLQMPLPRRPGGFLPMLSLSIFVPSTRLSDSVALLELFLRELVKRA
jgi:hypothetical protein